MEGIYIEEKMAKYDCLLFDLDDTLYPSSSGLATSCCENIEDYLLEKLGVEREKIRPLVNILYRNYGTTMAGLRAVGYEFDYDEYHSFVHGRLPYENLKPDPLLRSILLSLPTRKVIFTNADRAHTVKVLARLGLDDCFDGIICFETLNPAHSQPEVGVYRCGIFDILEHFSTSCGGQAAIPNSPVLCKPSPLAVQQALRMVNVDPSRAVFFDDSVRNIMAGKSAGLRTVLVGSWVKGVDFALESLHNMKEALPELWNMEETRSDNHSENVTVATSVLA